MKCQTTPIDATALWRFVQAQDLDERVISRADVNQWANKNFNGKTTRDERAAIVGKDFLIFLGDKLEAATVRSMSLHAGRHPTNN